MTTLDAGSPAPARATFRRKARAYAKLGKLSFYDYYLSALVAWTLLVPALRDEPRVLGMLILLSLGWVGVVAATVTFDDVTGYRDGSDQRNYDPSQGELRSRERKPLLDGHLTVREAVRFGYASIAWAVLMLAAALAVAPQRPWWAVALTAMVLLTSVQYSHGLKFSYRGGQELVLFASTGLTVLIPYALASGDASGLVLAEAYLFGLWSLLVSVYSNINDLAGDRAAGRRNMATRSSDRGYRVFVAVLTATETAAVVAVVAFGAVSAWFLLFLAPVLWVRARQVRTGLAAGDPLTARKLGIKAHRLGVVVLLAANLVLAT
ncbi:UbiA family prenyltransferase [Actinomadura viridis]|uniref:UbiA family prenyltransferase n=1 Tax=Actinomadura viridis TaxID=58110 RepID=UPI0036CEF27D